MYTVHSVSAGTSIPTMPSQQTNIYPRLDHYRNSEYLSKIEWLYIELHGRRDQNSKKLNLIYVHYTWDPVHLIFQIYF